MDATVPAGALARRLVVTPGTAARPAGVGVVAAVDPARGVLA